MIAGAEDEDFDNPPLHRGRRSFHRVKQRTSGEGGEDDEEEEALESWYQGPPDSPRRPKVVRVAVQYASALAESLSSQPCLFASHTAHRTRSRPSYHNKERETTPSNWLHLPLTTQHLLQRLIIEVLHMKRVTEP